MELRRLNELSDLEQFKSKNVTVYGAGKKARAVVRFAVNNEIYVRKIIVNNVQNNPKNVMGVPVKGITEEPCDGELIIISVFDESVEGIEGHLEKLGVADSAVVVTDELYKQMLLEFGDYENELVDRIESIERKLDTLSTNPFIKKPCLEYMVLNILDHCNLRCKGCDHFACIAKPYLVDYMTIHNDLERLSTIFHGDYIMKIAVMGGEPLLHPDLLKIICDVRKYFPYTKIRLTTNGMLLLQQGKEFWKTLRENRVTIVNTKYPINLDFDGMRKKAMEENVEFMHFEGTGDGYVKRSFKRKIQLEGQNNPVKSFSKCYLANYGNFLMEGKMYGCPFSCQSYRIFNSVFDQNLRLTEDDYLDIYKIDDKEKFFEFAARPKFYCRYCDGHSELFEWEQSKQDIHEWI